ncbi:MAG: transposase [Myxococcales bacterium]|nr:transposase [Myxococcales bacterium]
MNANLKYVSGSCENLLAHWDAMWTFVEITAVDPTNNHAERELRRRTFPRGPDEVFSLEP